MIGTYNIVNWGVGAIFAVAIGAAIMITVYVGLALSRLQDAAVLTVGSVALITSVVLVMLQGLQVRTLLDARDARDMADSGYAMDPDASVLRSYSLMLRPDSIAVLQSAFNVSALVGSGVKMTESAYVRCGTVVSMADVNFAADATFFVVQHGAAADAFHMDVALGTVTSIMILGALLRVVALTSLDFPGDTANVVGGIAATSDIYLLSARGSAGSVPVVTSTSAGTCKAVDTYMPWSWKSSFVNVSASSVITPLTQGATANLTLPAQVWGLGGR